MDILKIDIEEWESLPSEVRKGLSLALPEKVASFAKKTKPPKTISSREIVEVVSAWIRTGEGEERALDWLRTYFSSDSVVLPQGLCSIMAGLLEKGLEKEFVSLLDAIPQGVTKALDEVGVSGAEQAEALSWNLSFEGVASDKKMPVDGEVSYPTLMGVAVIHGRKWAVEKFLEKGCSPSAKRKGRKSLVSPTPLVLAGWLDDSESARLMVDSGRVDFCTEYGSMKKKEIVFGGWARGRHVGKEMTFLLDSSEDVRRAYFMKFGEACEKTRKAVLSELPEDLRAKVEMEMLSSRELGPEMRQSRAGKRRTGQV